MLKWDMESEEKPSTPPSLLGPPSSSWAELALADETLAQLHDLADRVLEARGSSSKGIDGSTSHGVVALFTGGARPPKLVAAQVLAGRLGAELVNVDVAALISQYIGETEKNLSRLFAAAEESDTVLFLDEADALFGERTDEKDAHGRYQNQEVDYLLGRIEGYSGLVILATNSPQEPGLALVRRKAIEVTFT